MNGHGDSRSIHPIPDSFGSFVGSNHPIEFGWIPVDLRDSESHPDPIVGVSDGSDGQIPSALFFNLISIIHNTETHMCTFKNG
jgi:hypothetical protein